MLKWDDLRYVLAVARAGNLAAAARGLGVGHTTVGRRLDAIEASLGARLFARSRGGYRATAAGRRLVAEANEIEARLDAAVLDVSGRDRRMVGPVRISATGTFIDGFLVPELAALHERHPGIVPLINGDPSIKDLQRREADIGVRSVEPRAPYLVARKLGEIATALYGSPDYLARVGAPRRGGKLAGHTVIRFPPTWRVEGAWMDEHAGAATTVARFDRWGNAISAIRAGLGLGLVECYLGDRDDELVRVFRRPAFRESWWLAIHEDMRSNARVKATADFVLERARARRAELDGRGSSAS